MQGIVNRFSRPAHTRAVFGLPQIQFFPVATQGLAYHLAQELCLGQFDVWEGRVPEQMCQRYEQLPTGLPVGEQGQDCSLLPLTTSHEVPECALLAVRKRVSEAARDGLWEVM